MASDDPVRALEISSALHFSKVGNICGIWKCRQEA